MRLKTKLLFFMCLPLMVTACQDDDIFSTSSANRLVFSVDTVKLDTVFSNVPTATKTFWAYNPASDGVRLSSVRLEQGTTSGYRVNVDGVYLGETSGYSASDIEVHRKDSIRVFVELTAPENGLEGPQRHDDNLIFTLENDTEQRVSLSAYTWDATVMRNVRISRDSILADNGKPIIIYGGIIVDSTATLTLAAGTTLYFHNDAGIDVYGSLHCEGTAGSEVVLRGDRIDRMFSYLPYDRTPGQWQGIHLYPSARDNRLKYTDLHSAYNGIIADSSAIEKDKLWLSSVTIHNCQGYGLWAKSSNVTMENTVVSNTLGDCVRLDNAVATVNQCTLAQFYPFDANRGVALRFAANEASSLMIRNTLITGYADDELMGGHSDSTATARYHFDHCIIRTPKVETADSTNFVSVNFENVKDTTMYGEKHFVKLDTDNLIYDFRLKASSSAIDKADPLTALPTDRLGVKRDERPDVGAYEWFK